MDLLIQEKTTEAIKWICAENEKFRKKFTEEFYLICKNVRCLGTILAFEIADGKDEYLNNISTIITQQSLEQGVYIRPLGNTVYIMPPYCITKDELDKVYYVLMDLMEKLKNVLEKR